MSNLVADIDRTITELLNADESWKRFIYDHKKHIISDSVCVPMTAADQDRYRHKIYHYLRDKECPQDIHWVAIFINELMEFEDFTLKPNILIPKRPTIVNLYRSYRTSAKTITL